MPLTPAQIEANRKRQEQLAAQIAASIPQTGRAGALGAPVSIGSAYAPQVQTPAGTSGPSAGGFMGVPGLNPPPVVGGGVGSGLAGINFGAAGNAALANLPGYQPSAASAPAAAAAAATSGTSGGGTSGGGGSGVTAQRAYQMAGGAAKTGMTLAEYMQWWNKQTTSLRQAGIQQDPYSWAISAGLGWAGALQQPGAGQVFAGAGTNVFKPGSDWRQFTNPSTLNETGVDYIIQALTGDTTSSPAERKRRAERASQFAGLEQWRANLAGNQQYVLDNPYLWNAQMVGFSDPNALSVFLGQLNDVPNAPFGAGGGSYLPLDQLQQQFAQREALVPEWASEVQASLASKGVDYLPVELLGDPSINYTDPSQPLFPAGSNPPSLIGLSGGQLGELSFLRSLDAQELLGDLGPLYDAYYNREAGAPPPPGFEAGLAGFGSPVYNPGPDYPSGASGGNYTRNPLMGLYGGPQQIGAGVLQAQGLEGVTDPYELGRELGGGLYNRWSAYGYPGTGDQYTVGGPRLAGTDENGAIYEDYRIDPFSGGYATDPYFADFWNTPTFQPWQNLPPEVIQRLLALRADPTFHA